MPDRPAEQRDLRAMANAIRVLAMDAVDRARSGHQGMPMGMADVATTLYAQFLKFDAAAPAWPDRDRVVLSAGHGSMLLYALLHLTGSADMTMEEIRAFRKLGSKTAGHPEHGHAKGIETTTGPLGQGLGNAVGMAIAEAHLNAVFGAALVDHRTYVFASDGDLMEGISHEAGALAGHLKLKKLIVLFDDNNITIDGPRSLSDSVDQIKRFDALGWTTTSIDGHDTAAISTALERAQSSDRPTLIACKTLIGYGSPNVQGKAPAHHYGIMGDELTATRDALGWPHAPFEIPAGLVAQWRSVGARGSEARQAWEKRLGAAPADQRADLERRLKRELPPSLLPALTQHARQQAQEPQKPDYKKIATRKASELALDVINEHLTETIGGSADLTGSNNTKTKSQKPLTAADYSGRYIYYGIREHGMAAAMNGMALHGGVLPYGGTFLVFTDYCRPSIRLAALTNQRVIFVMTHDSIGLGEDGPTHQPIEHLAALRAIPNLTVFRPADAVETAECWALALQAAGPSILALSRQNVAPVRKLPTDENLSAKGAYVLSPAKGRPRMVLIGTGSEVEIALRAQEVLAAQGVATNVVSMPSTSLFDRQTPAYRNQVLPKDVVKLAVEAASPMGWDEYVGDSGAFMGLDHFGASAPYEDLFREFGLTAGRLVQMARERL